MSASFLMLSKL